MKRESLGGCCWQASERARVKQKGWLAGLAAVKKEEASGIFAHRTDRLAGRLKREEEIT